MLGKKGKRFAASPLRRVAEYMFPTSFLKKKKTLYCHDIDEFYTFCVFSATKIKRENVYKENTIIFPLRQFEYEKSRSFIETATFYLEVYFPFFSFNSSYLF